MILIYVFVFFLVGDGKYTFIFHAERYTATFVMLRVLSGSPLQL